MTKDDGQSAPATINLNDCLACSGCITSSEGILITSQSQSILLDFLQDRQDKLLVITVSPQSLASLVTAFLARLNPAERARYSPDVVQKAVLHLLREKCGADVLLDVSVGRAMAHLALQAEFDQRRQADTLPLLISACPGTLFEDSPCVRYRETETVNRVGLLR